MLRLGRYRLGAVEDGSFALDGGSLFGVVPRTRWAEEVRPDGRNRVRLAIRCLLCLDQDSGRRILVDAGIGEALDPEAAERLALDRSGGGLDAGLAAHGLSRADITDVVLTHLHLDHAGGLVRPGPGGRPQLAFPCATVHVQRRAWHWAHAPTELDRSDFHSACCEALAHSSQLHLVDGEGELFPGFEVTVSEGHTTAQQLPRIRGDGAHLTHCGDLIPTVAHLRIGWVAAYDLRPLTTIEEKKVLLAEALEDDGILFFGHDPGVAACRLAERDGEPTFREAVAL
jgi:glyoxylase-like metal-dependent hydrolase (beta-lactamase superfamily II)